MRKMPKNRLPLLLFLVISASVFAIQEVLHSVEDTLTKNLVGSCAFETLAPTSITLDIDAMHSISAANRGPRALTELDKYRERTGDSPSKRNGDPDSPYIVLPVRASVKEVEDFRALPEALSWINERLALGIIKGEPSAEKWAARNDAAWTVPPEHPRANKSLCLRYAQMVRSQPLPLYSDNPAYFNRDETTRELIRSKQDLMNELNEFFLLHKQHAVIHDSGIVASQCGYWQPLEACETRFKILGRRWFQACSKMLIELGIDWTVFAKANSSNAALLSAQKNQHNVEDDQSIFKEKWPKLCLPKAILDKLSPASPSAHNHSFSQYLPDGMPHYPKVFVITAAWDYNYHHFLLDSIVRIIRFLPFLKQNPDVKIHTRFHEQMNRPKNDNYKKADTLRRRIMNLIGLDPDRLIFGFVKASEVFIPRSMNCNQVQTNSLEARLLAKYLLKIALKQSSEEFLPTHSPNENKQSPIAIHQQQSSDIDAFAPKTIFLQQRYCPIEENCTDWRSWTNERHDVMLKYLTNKFPQSRIMSINDFNASQVDCLACEIRGYSETDVLIGYHGAGLTNVMFMKPGSLLVEMTGQFDGRMLPKCGYHGPLSTVFGVHHYIHYFDSRGEQPLDFDNVVDRIALFYEEIAKRRQKT